MSQRNFVIEQLNTTGEISRNYCLSKYITRLADIIFKLKKDGWQFTKEDRNGDCVYIVTDKPKTGVTFNKKMELKEIKQKTMFDKPKPHYLYD